MGDRNGKLETLETNACQPFVPKGKILRGSDGSGENDFKLIDGMKYVVVLHYIGKFGFVAKCIRRPDKSH